MGQSLSGVDMGLVPSLGIGPVALVDGRSVTLAAVGSISLVDIGSVISYRGSHSLD